MDKNKEEDCGNLTETEKLKREVAKKLHEGFDKWRRWCKFLEGKY